MAVETFYPPYAGINTEVQPNDIPKGQAQEARNLLAGFPGKAPVRGPLRTSSSFSATPALTVKSIWPHTNGGFAVTYGANLIKWFSSPGAAGTTVVPDDVDHIPGRQSVCVGDLTYGVGLSAADGGSALQGLISMANNGTNARHAHAPRGNVGVAYMLNRLFVLGDTDPDAIGKMLNQAVALYWTDPMDGVSSFADDDPATWKDNTSGLLNKIVLDGFNGANKPIGLGVMGRHLAVFGRYSIHVLRGTGPSDWSMRREITGIGCLDARSIVSVEDGVYFASDNGYYFYDGTDLRCVSKNVRRKFNVLGASVVVNRVTAARIAPDYLLVTVGHDDPTLGHTAGWNGLLHMPTESWTSFSSDVMVPSSHMAWIVAAGPLTSAACDGQRIWALDEVAVPTATTYDVLGTAKTGIPAWFQSKVSRLAQPLATAKLTGIEAGAKLFLFNGVNDGVTSWHYELHKPDNGLLVDLGAAISPSALEYTQRAKFERFEEVDEVSVIAWLNGPAASTTATAQYLAELQEVSVGFEATRLGTSF